MRDKISKIELHKLLLRQLKRSEIENWEAPPTQEQWLDLLDRVSRTYLDAEQDRYTLERSMAQSSKELQELNELKTRFFFNISNEFRTPLTLLVLPLEALASGAEKPTPEYLENLALNANKILNSADALLDFSLVDGGQFRLNAYQGNLGGLMKEIVLAASPYAQKRGIKMGLTGVDALPESIFDYPKMEIVLGHLLANALKFSPDHSQISITGTSTSTTVSLSIHDSGQSISESELLDIFDRFYLPKLNNLRMGEMGLALLFEYVNFHGGELTAKNHPEIGRIFTVQLPILPAFALEIDKREIPTQEGHHPTQNLPYQFEDLEVRKVNEAKEIVKFNEKTRTHLDPLKNTLLCLEPHFQIRAELVRLLSPRYNIYLASDTESAWELILNAAPDLILSETDVPIDGGLALCKKLRSNARVKNLPFIFLTTHSDRSAKNEGLEAGADDFLGKPFSEWELKPRIDNLLRQRKHLTQLKREIKIARDIQVSLLPKGAELCFPGLELDALFVPAEVLSGDFYDCTLNTSGPWVYFYLADVTQHGLPSAQITYLLKEIFQNAWNPEYAPPPLFDLLSEVQERYATHLLPYDIALQVGRFNLNSKVLEYIRAGIPPGILLRNGEAAAFLPGEAGDVISANYGMTREHYMTHEIQLRENDTIYFYSDGLPEVTKRTLKIFSAASTSNDWKASVLEQLKEAQGNLNFPDDITVIKLKI